MKKVLIMRGIPGSGKSTYVAQAVGALLSYQVASVCSADTYFLTGPDKEYIFDLSKIGQAHAACFSQFMSGLLLMKKDFLNLLVVDNTNVRAWEPSAYIQLARYHHVDIEIVRFHIDPAVAGPRNRHGVPQEAVDRMAKSMERLPPALGKETVVNVN